MKFQSGLKVFCMSKLLKNNASDLLRKTTCKIYFELAANLYINIAIFDKILNLEK